MKTYLCRFTYSKGNGYALVTANRVSGIENILRAQGMWEGVHVLDCKELDICIPLCGTLVITATGITTLGMSAYDLAVDAGFKGTTEEWLASLIGPKGDKGDTGEGIASGGKEGQILKKNSDADYDTRWEDFVIPDALILSDWELSDNTKADFIKNKPTIPAALVLSDWNEDNTTSKAYIQNKPTNVSTFNNDSGFITKTVDDLANYYLKHDTYTKDEVQQLVSAIKQFSYVVVHTLPEASAETMHCIYLVPSADPQAQNIKDEYITIQSDSQRDVYFWEQIGSTAIDLSGYYTSAETDNAISTALTAALADYTTTAALTLLLAGKQDKEAGKGLSTNDFTDADKAKVDALKTVATTGSYNDLTDKPTIPAAQVNSDWNAVSGVTQILNKPTNLVKDENYVHTDNNYTNEDKQKVNNALQSETDPTVPQWAKQPQKPTYTAQEVGALPNSTKYGSTIDLAMDSATYVLTLSLKDQDGTVLNTKTVDLPIESVVVNGRYDAVNEKIVLTLQSGSTIDVPVGDLISGLQTEITSVNMLDADLVDDTNSTHKFVTAQEKTTWDNKYTKPQTGIPASDIEAGVIPVIPSNTSYFSNYSGVGIVPEDGIRAETVANAATMSINPDVLTLIDGTVGTATITLQVPNDNLAHVWDIMMTTDSTVNITLAMSNSATIKVPSGFAIGASADCEISVIGKGTKYYLRYGEFA